MRSRIETIINSKDVSYDVIYDANNLVLENGLKAININSCWIDHYSNFPEKCRMNINSDLFFSNDDPRIRLDKIKSILKYYRHLTTTLNIGPISQHIVENDWSSLEKDIQAVVEEAGQYVDTRLWLNGIFFLSENEVFRTVDIAEQSGIKEVMIGTTKESLVPIESALIAAGRVKRYTNINVGLFGHIKDVEFFNILEKSPLDSIGLSHSNIFQLFL